MRDNINQLIPKCPNWTIKKIMSMVKIDYNTSLLSFLSLPFTLCCYGVLLFLHWPSCINVAGLEDHSSVAKDEIHCAIDVAISVELSLGVHIESVLVPFKATPIEH